MPDGFGKAETHMKISEVLAIAEARHARFAQGARTCDGVIVGDASRECTGIAVTCSPSVPVIREAAKRNCNLLICHEPTFYDGMDETGWLRDDTVFRGKAALLEETGMTVYRNHDHLHSDVPDGIFGGVTKALGWEPYRVENADFPAGYFQLPTTTVGEIAKRCCAAAHIDGLRMVGDPAMEVERAAFLFHFSGGPMDRTLLQLVEKWDVQVILTGETVDWTVVAYVQDALALGKKRALVTPGHYSWEEPGMEVYAAWLREALQNRVPVAFIPSGHMYRWVRG